MLLFITLLDNLSSVLELTCSEVFPRWHKKAPSWPTVVCRISVCFPISSLLASGQEMAGCFLYKHLQQPVVFCSGLFHIGDHYQLKSDCCVELRSVAHRCLLHGKLHWESKFLYWHCWQLHLKYILLFLCQMASDRNFSTAVPNLGNNTTPLMNLFIHCITWPEKCTLIGWSESPPIHCASKKYETSHTITVGGGWKRVKCTLICEPLLTNRSLIVCYWQAKATFLQNYTSLHKFWTHESYRWAQKLNRSRKKCCFQLWMKHSVFLSGLTLTVLTGNENRKFSRVFLMKLTIFLRLFFLQKKWLSISDFMWTLKQELAPIAKKKTGMVVELKITLANQTNSGT